MQEPSFSDTIRELRIRNGLSQQQLANKLYVDRSSIAHWESGRRVPDAIIISRLARYFGVDVSMLLATTEVEVDPPLVIVVDDEQTLLQGAMAVLTRTLPDISITGFLKPSEAIEYAHDNRISLAFLDIELGKMNGLDLCQTLIDINPFTNVVFLTGYADYAIDAWNTGACGFLVKPLRPEDVMTQLGRLRYPLRINTNGAQS